MPYRREGSENWYISIKGVRRSAGTSVFSDAKALEDKLNHDAWLQDRMGVKPPKSWQEAVVKWLDEKAGKLSIQDDIEKLKWLDQYIGSVSDIGRITRDQIDAIMQLREGVRTDGATPQNCTANKYVALVAGILNGAERQWEWGNRAPRLRRYKTREDVGRALTVQEWWRLEKELPTHFRPVATFAISTGLRAQKVFALTWSQLTRDAMCFSGAGNKLGNTIPLNLTAQGVIEQIKRRKVVHSTNVFTYAGRPFKYYGDSWQRALERAGIERIRFQDLRVTFNTWLAEKGVPEQIQKRLLGHSTKQVHDRYTLLNVEHLRPYSNLIDSILTQSSGQKAANG